jgi:hypothetical protein
MDALNFRQLHCHTRERLHRFMTPLDEFMRRIGQQFEIDRRIERSLKISRDSLPGTLTVIILDGV